VLASPCDGALAGDASAFGKQRVSFRSGELTLAGFLFRPEGSGPFRALLWNHGSEKDPDGRGQFDAVAAVFVPAGYVVFAPLRRGHGDSEGRYIQQELRGESAERRLRRQVELLEGEQLDDQLAALAWLKGLGFVDASRIAVAGCSYGGIQALLGAERGAGYKAAVAISPAALSWPRNPLLQQRLVRAAQQVQVPVFLLQPPRDASLEPAHVLGHELEQPGKPHRVRIYPDDIPRPLQTHCFGSVARGIHVWSRDALEFLYGALR
jgi:dienelactone hydrolase